MGTQAPTIDKPKIAIAIFSETVHVDGWALSGLGMIEAIVYNYRSGAMRTMND